MDTGSSECLIKTTTGLIHQFPVHYDTINLKCFRPSDFKVPLDMNIDDASVEGVNTRIVPDDAQATDHIIGRAFTEAHHIMYTKVGDTMYFTEQVKIMNTKGVGQRVKLGRDTEIL